MTGRNGQGGWRPLWLEGRFLKGSRRSQPSEEEEVRSLRSQRGAGRGTELANVDSSGSGRGCGWMKMERRVVLWETDRMKYPPKNLAAEKMLTFSREHVVSMQVFSLYFLKRTRGFLQAYERRVSLPVRGADLNSKISPFVGYYEQILFVSLHANTLSNLANFILRILSISNN